MLNWIVFLCMLLTVSCGGNNKESLQSESDPISLVEAHRVDRVLKKISVDAKFISHGEFYKKRNGYFSLVEHHIILTKEKTSEELPRKPEVVRSTHFRIDTEQINENPHLRNSELNEIFYLKNLLNNLVKVEIISDVESKSDPFLETIRIGSSPYAYALNIDLKNRSIVNSLSNAIEANDTLFELDLSDSGSYIYFGYANNPMIENDSQHTAPDVFYAKDSNYYYLIYESEFSYDYVNIKRFDYTNHKQTTISKFKYEEYLNHEFSILKEAQNFEITTVFKKEYVIINPNNQVNKLFASLKVNREKYTVEVAGLSNHCDIETEYNPTTDTVDLIFKKATKTDTCRFALFFSDPSTSTRLGSYIGLLKIVDNN